MPAQTPKRKALIVDDEHAVADTLARLLNQNGFEATAVYNGSDAIRSAGELRPDVVISDVHMAGMSGLDTVVRIKNSFPDCRVLLLSGSLPTQEELDAAQSEGHSFEILNKPVHPQELLAKLGVVR
jgi:CheY-like chemotaxis protein